MYMKMNHICGETSFNSNKLDFVSCGVCSKIFTSICLLHLHLVGHSSGGSYHYDNVLKLAFPKNDSTCVSTQTYMFGLQNFHLDKWFERKADVIENRVKYAKSDRQPITESKDEEAEDVEESFKNDHYVRVENSSSKLLSGRIVNRDLVERGRKKECTISSENLSDTLDHLNAFVGDESERNSMRKKKKVQKQTNKGSEENHFPSSPKVTTNIDLSGFDNEDGNVNDVYVGNDNIDKSNIKQETDIDMFRIPNSIKRKKEMGMSKTSEKETEKEKVLKILLVKRKEKRMLNKVKNQTGKIETVFSDDVKHDFEDTDTVNEESDIFENNNYFYGKIISEKFTIERQKSDEILCKGEKKSKSNQIVVDGTWYPELEENNSLIPSEILNSGSDKLETIKIKEFKVIDPNSDFSNENKNSKTESRKDKKSKFKCSQCGKTFKHLYHFEGHMNFHVGLTPYMCQYCGKVYANRTTLQMHERLKHSDKSTWYRCSICANSFATPGRLRAHQLTHSTDYSHICLICNKSYKNHTLLKRHQKYVHNSKQHKCQNCRQSFDTQKEYEIHQRSKHGKEIKCETCGRKFTSERSKNRHTKSHLSVKPHQCHICLRRFLQKTPFWIHMEKYHDLTKTNLIQLFPEKHLGRNQQHLIKVMTNTDNLEKDNEDEISDSLVHEEHSDEFLVNDELLFASPVNLA